MWSLFFFGFFLFWLLGIARLQANPYIGLDKVGGFLPTLASIQLFVSCIAKGSKKFQWKDMEWKILLFYHFLLALIKTELFSLWKNLFSVWSTEKAIYGESVTKENAHLNDTTELGLFLWIRSPTSPVKRKRRRKCNWIGDKYIGPPLPALFSTSGVWIVTWFQILCK